VFASHLDFVNTSDEKIRELFYKPNRHSERSVDGDGRIIFPPQAIRRTAIQIREFFELGLRAKKEKIEQCHNLQISTDQMIKYLDSEFASQGEEQPRKQVVPAPSAATTAANEPFSQDTTDEVDEVDFDQADLEFGYTLGKTWGVNSNFCPGITISYIKNMRLDDEVKSRRILGFKHTIREGFTTRTRLEHPDRTGKWPFCLPVVGAIANGNNDTEIVWRVEEVEGYSNSGSDDLSGIPIAVGGRSRSKVFVLIVSERRSFC
jgi:hypothetical protein